MISPVKIWRRQKEIRSILGKTGTIVTWTEIFVPPKDFKKFAPYAVVMVEFKKGERAFGQLVDYQKTDLIFGRNVVVVLRKVREGMEEDVIAYGVKFKPIKL